MQHGLDGRIARLTLMSKLEQTNEYNLTRDFITSSYKYGLTTGSFASVHLEVTNLGKEVLSLNASSKLGKEKLFKIAIARFDPFHKLYQKLEGRPLPDTTVLSDELIPLGVTSKDGPKAAAVFVENIKYLGLVMQVNDRDHVNSIDSLLNELPSADEMDGGNENAAAEGKNTEGPLAVESHRPDSTNTAPSLGNVVQGPVVSNEPSIHIDVQIHIDSSATPEQIDKIFASMARYLYRREG